MAAEWDVAYIPMRFHVPAFDPAPPWVDCTGPHAPSPVASAVSPVPLPPTRVALAAAALALSQGAQPAVTPLDPSARLVAASTSGYADPAALVLSSPDGWAAAWRTLHGGLAAGPPPAVDFGRDVVVLVAAGERATGGYTVRIDGTSDLPGGRRVVHATRTAPGPECMTAQVVTSPVAAARVPRPAGGPGAVTVSVRDAVASC